MKSSGKLIAIVLADDAPAERELTLEAFAECHLVNPVDGVEEGERLMEERQRDNHVSKKDETLLGLMLLPWKMLVRNRETPAGRMK